MSFRHRLATTERPLRFVLILAVLAAAMGTALVPSVAHAAESDLSVVSEARYDVLPADGLVRVTADLTVRYTRASTKARRWYVDHVFLAVMPGTSGFRVTGDGGPSVRVSRDASAFTMLRIDLGQRLYGGGTRTLRLRFDLRDPGGAPTRELRVSEALVAFPAWAFASDGGGPSSVTVVVPPGYELDVGSGPLPERSTTEDGRQVLRSGPIADPGSFFAYVVGQGEGAFSEQRIEAQVAGDAVTIRLRAWEDDPAWGERVAGLLTPALPVLGERIGIPWRSRSPLVVEESTSRSTTAYAGLFDPAEGRVEIAYYADPFVVLHEAAHAWFNGSLLADRWANEGFASMYAADVAKELGVDVAPETLTEELQANAVPLNAWDPEADEASESYGYAAALELARAIRERAGDESLREVWAAAADGIGAYQPRDRREAAAPPTEPEPADGPPDWRGLLDLLEDRTGERFDDLWRTWVVRDGEASLLETREAARASYRRTLALADGWSLPRGVRDALRAWRFEVAEAYLTDLRTVIAQREALESAASLAGQSLPTTVRDAFEAGLLADASTAATTQLEAIDVIVDTAALRPVDPDPVTLLGLVDQQPDVDLAAARAALASGDVAGALASAESARTAWDLAWDLGRRRILIALAAFVTSLMFLGLGITAVRRRFRRVPDAARTHLASPVDPPATPAG